MSPKEPRWLHLEVVLAIHDALIRLNGGLAGVRELGLLESALARPRNLFAYGTTDVFALAASHAAGIARNHPFNDGNKRTAFVAMATFLEENGRRLEAAEGEAVIQMVSLARGDLDEKALAAWLRDGSKSKARRASKARSKRKRKGR